MRVRDNAGQLSAWSDPATWTMGILDPDRWQAEWITANPATYNSLQLPLFRRTFQLDRKISHAVLYACGLGQHELRLNGEKVGDDVLAPGWTYYSTTCLYVAHDVSAALRPGSNALGVLLGNGMYNVTGGRYAKFKASFGPPKLLLHLHITYADGSESAIVSDADWRVAPSPITFSCIYGGEDYDARLEQRGWDTPDFPPAGDWHPPSITTGPGGRLTAQSAPLLRINRSFSSVASTEPRPGVRIFDLGQNFSGWPAATVRGTAGTKITLTTGELLGTDGLVSQKNTGKPVNFSYTAGGVAQQSWQPRFSLTGFRYLQLEQSSPADVQVSGQFVHAAAPVVGTFECSNDLFNRIHRLINFAILSNLHSVLTDCPHREKLGWLEQTHLMAPGIMANYDVDNFFRKITRDMRDAQHANGCVPTIAPQYTSFKGQWDIFNDSPEWGSAIVLVPWQAYCQYGDPSILEENYAAMQRYVAYLHSREDAGQGGQGGLIDYGLGDWYDIGPGDPGFCKLTSKSLTATATYYQNLVAMQRTATLLQKPDDAAHYAAEAARILTAFNQHLFNPTTHVYDRGSQTAQAMPLALGLVDPDHRDTVLNHLIADIRAHDNHITAGDIGFRYVVQALSAANRSDVIADLLSRTDAPSYGFQLARGATSLTEAWDANPKNSQNHLMLGHAEAWLHQSLAGIAIDFSDSTAPPITIRPAIVGDVTWAKATHQSVLGPIACAWNRQGDRLHLDVTIPPGATALVHIPTSDPATIHEGRMLASSAPGVQLRDGAIYQVASGHYLFESIFAELPKAE